MNHKEEAIKRVEEFSPHAKYWDCYNDEPLNENHAKQCALLAINREIELINELSDDYRIGWSVALHEKQQELILVKKEIELL